MKNAGLPVAVAAAEIEKKWQFNAAAFKNTWAEEGEFREHNKLRFELNSYAPVCTQSIRESEPKLR